MLYMKEMRAKVVAECTLKESAAINQILGRRVSVHNMILTIWYIFMCIFKSEKDIMENLFKKNKKFKKIIIISGRETELKKWFCVI